MGPATIKKLLREVGSLNAVKLAPVEELSRVIGPAAAKRVFEHYHPGS